MNEKEDQLIRIDVAGKDEHTWTKLQPKFFDLISNLLDFKIDPINNSTIRDEMQKFANVALDYGKAKLSKPGIDNQKVLAEVEELYSKAQKNHAEARKINAEAAAIEQSNTIKNLKIALGAAKILLFKDNGKEALIFIKAIDDFQKLLSEYQEESNQE